MKACSETRLRTLSVAAAFVVLLAASFASAETNLKLFDFEDGVSGWGGATLTMDNVHGGKRAMLWRVAGRPGLNSPGFTMDMSDFTELRFWAWSDKKTDFYIPIVFPCQGGYWLAPWRVDWTGWKEQRIPLSSFKPMRSNIDWKAVSSLGFRAQGYGQKAVPQGMTLVLDDFSLYSPKEIGVKSMAELQKESRAKRLVELKATGNPYYAQVVSEVKNYPAHPDLKMDFDNAWQFRTLAEKAYAAAWAATSDDSPRKGDATLISCAVAHIDFILANHKDGTWKYSRKWPGVATPTPTASRWGRRCTRSTICAACPIWRRTGSAGKRR